MSGDQYLDRPDVVVPPQDMAREEELQARFEEGRIAELCDRFFVEGVPGVNLKEQINDRGYVVAYIPATSEFADIGRAVETTVFAKTFRQTLTQVDRDYGKYDSASTFAVVIDVADQSRPKAAGALRITEYDPELGFKDVNDLLEDSPENPWIDEIKDNYFAPDEPYDQMTAWKRLGERKGVDLKLEESQDIATHASGPDYRGAHGELSGVSILFFHACLRYAVATKAKNLLAIFDLPPLANLQQYGDPFDTYEDLQPHPYGGPYDTIPAFAQIEEGLARVFAKAEIYGQIFRDGYTLDQQALMPNEYLPDLYSNKAVGVQDN